LDNPLISPKLHTLAQDFLWNAENTLADSSPFYARLARRVADDPEILTLAAHTPPHQPVMNLLFSSVHYLLLRGIEDPLAMFFQDLTREPNTQDDPYPFFRAFCLEHADEIIGLLRTRRVQTNEVARCSLLFPAFALISQRVGAQPLALIEVGSSAGLNLNWDRYAYKYGDGVLYGDVSSPVVLQCELRGELRPLLPREFPNVASRVGIDLNPNDVLDDDAMLWLRALIWPEQHDRADRLQKAIALARQAPPQLFQGDALELAPRLIQQTPPEIPTVLFHSFVLNQVPRELRTRYYELLAEHSSGRMLFDVAIEPSAWPCPMVLTTFQNSTPIQETLATCDYHGRWLEWKILNDAPL
jgi:hypothetical protein